VLRAKYSLALLLAAAGCVWAAALAWSERTHEPQMAARPMTREKSAAWATERRNEQREGALAMAVVAARRAKTVVGREAIFSQTVVDWVERDRSAGGSRENVEKLTGRGETDALRVALQA
jgi:hypothetical protein